MASVNNAARNLAVQVSLQDPVFSNFGYISRSEIAGSYDGSVLFKSSPKDRFIDFF